MLAAWDTEEFRSSQGAMARPHLKTRGLASEMAQWAKALGAKPDALSWITRTHGDRRPTCTSYPLASTRPLPPKLRGKRRFRAMQASAAGLWPDHAGPSPVYRIPFISTDMLILLLPLALATFPAESWRLSAAVGAEVHHSGQRCALSTSSIRPSLRLSLVGVFHLLIYSFYDQV